MSDTFDTAITLLNSADEEKRLEGIRLLGTMKEARAAEVLIGIIRHEIRRRRYIWRFLMRRWRVFRYLPLIEDLRQWNYRLLEEVAQALVGMGHSAVTPLVAAVEVINLDTESVAVDLFVWALGEIGDLNALAILRKRARIPIVESSTLGATVVHQAAQEAVKKIEAANADILDKPIPAVEPQPSLENLPIPAKEPELPTEDLPRPSEEGLFTDDTDCTDERH